MPFLFVAIGFAPVSIRQEVFCDLPPVAFSPPVFVASAVHAAVRACSLPEVAFAVADVPPVGRAGFLPEVAFSAVDAPPAVQVGSPPVGAFAVVDVQPAVPGVPVADCGSAPDDWAALQADRCALGAARPDDCSVARSGARSAQAVAPLDGSPEAELADWYRAGYSAPDDSVALPEDDLFPDDSPASSYRDDWSVAQTEADRFSVAVAVRGCFRDGYRAHSVADDFPADSAVPADSVAPDLPRWAAHSEPAGWAGGYRAGSAKAHCPVVRVALRSEYSRAENCQAVQDVQRLAGFPACRLWALLASPEAPALRVDVAFVPWLQDAFAAIAGAAPVVQDEPREPAADARRVQAEEVACVSQPLDGS